MGAEVVIVAPPTLLPPAVERWGATVATDLDAVLPELDVLYLLRVQRERMQGAFFPSTREYARIWGVDQRRLGLLKPDALVMHPGPMNRGVEISGDVADSDRAVITEQVTNGIAMRMAVLYLLLAGGGRIEMRRTRCDDELPALPADAGRRHRAGGAPVTSSFQPPARVGTGTILLRGGRVLDPASGTDAVRDVLVRDGDMVEVAADLAAPRRHRGGGLHGTVDHAGPGRPAHPPARARLRGRRGHRHRLGGGCGRRLHGAVRDGQHRPGVRQRGGRGDGVAPRPGGRPRRRVPGRVDHQGPGGGGADRVRRAGRLRGRVDFFSDDGKPVADALVMRRALQYALAFDAVLCNHAEEPTLTADAQMNEGEWSSVLGLPGWPHEAEEVMIARDLLLAEGLGARLHVPHVTTAGAWRSSGSRRLAVSG
jgi:hypothetical protein